MAASCLRCAAKLPFDGAPCPECGSLAPAPEFYLGPAERPSIHEELLEHLRVVTSGEFEILGEIGHGGMARVYLANEVALDRQVALKVLSPLFAEYPEIVKRFQHEARTAGQLNHPHIVPVFAVYQGDGLSFFTMPFVKGASFREILHESAPLETDEALLYLRQAASGLAYAHQHGVIHRDVKPENMMLEETTGRLVLTDFGLAKALGAESLTVPGDMIGTPHYMAPEQCEGDGEVDGRADQYSLALVAYEMLAGEYPFEVNGFREILMKQLTEDPPPLEERRPDLPDCVCEAIHRALSKSPDDRFDSIDDFARAMLGGDAIERPNPTRRHLRRKRRLFDAKTVWMRDRLLRLHRRRRLRKWTGRAALTAAASLSFYLAVAALSRGLPAANSDGAAGIVDPVANGSPEASADLVFVDIAPPLAGELTTLGPPAPVDDRAEDTPPPRPSADESPARQASATPTRRAGSGRQQPQSTPVTEQVVQNEPATPDPAAVTAEEADEQSTPASGDPDPVAEQPTSQPAEAEAPPAASRITPEMVVERYRSALETEDVAELARLYGGEVPSQDLEMLTRIFNSAEEIQVEANTRDQRANGDRMTVDVDFAMRYVLARTQRSQKYTLKLRMTLAEGPSGWQLVELDQR